MSGEDEARRIRQGQMFSKNSPAERLRLYKEKAAAAQPPAPPTPPPPPPQQYNPATFQQQLSGMYPAGNMPGIGGNNFGGIDPNQMYPGASYFGQGQVQQPNNVMTPQHAQSGGFASIFGAPGPMGLSGLFGGQ